MVLLTMLGSASRGAQALEQKCPVGLDQVEVSYRHNGSESKPLLRIKFGNDAGKNIAAVTFSLSLLDANGYPRPYPEDILYRDGLDAGMRKFFTWELSPESVDIHRTGETVLVEEVEFADNSTWSDDGSQSCALTVDFHAK